MIEKRKICKFNPVAFGLQSVSSVWHSEMKMRVLLTSEDKDKNSWLWNQVKFCVRIFERRKRIEISPQFCTVCSLEPLAGTEVGMHQARLCHAWQNVSPRMRFRDH